MTTTPTQYHISIPKLMIPPKVYDPSNERSASQNKSLRTLNTAFEVYEKTPNKEIFIHRIVQGKFLRKPKKRSIPDNWLSFSTLDEAFAAKLALLTRLRLMLNDHISLAQGLIKTTELPSDIKAYIAENPDLFI